MPRAIAALLCLNAVSAGTGIRDFRGALKLAHSMEGEAAELLVYANNANEPGVLDKGSILPLNLNTGLIPAGACCLHRATPSLSSDGRRIAYVRRPAAQPSREAVMIYDIASKSEKPVFEAEVVWGVSWDPMGNRLAVVADRAPDQRHNIYVMALESQAVSQQTHGPLQLEGREYVISDHAQPAWSPAGTQLAIEVRRSERQSEDSTAGVIELWDIQTNEFSKLTDGLDPAWSPKGGEVAFFDTSRQKCFTVRADGSRKTLLFALGKRPFPSSSAPLFYPVVWSPDGTQLIFHQWVAADVITDVYRLDLTNRKLKFLGATELQVVNWRTSR